MNHVSLYSCIIFHYHILFRFFLFMVLVSKDIGVKSVAFAPNDASMRVEFKLSNILDNSGKLQTYGFYLTYPDGETARFEKSFEGNISFITPLECVQLGSHIISTFGTNETGHEITGSSMSPYRCKLSIVHCTTFELNHYFLFRNLF